MLFSSSKSAHKGLIDAAKDISDDLNGEAAEEMDASGESKEQARSL